MSRSYMWRLGLFALVFLAYAGWSAWDGFFRYPAINKIWDTYAQYQKDHPDNWQQTWADYAKANHLPDTPEQAKVGFNLYAQYIQLAICLPIGLVALAGYLRGYSRWVALDDQGLSSSWGQKVPFASVTGLNKERWRSKGIALVEYKEGDKHKSFVLDDWKYDRQPITDMVREVESRLTPDQITGDVPAVTTPPVQPAEPTEPR